MSRKYPEVVAAALTSNSATAVETLGAVFYTAGKAYIYGQLSSGCAAAGSNGCAYVWEDLDSYIFTNDTSDGYGANGNAPAGVGIGTLTSNYFGWIQVRGEHTAVDTDGDDDIAIGDTIYVAAGDGVVEATTGGTAPLYTVLGVATAADTDASNTVAAVILCPIM